MLQQKTDFEENARPVVDLSRGGLKFLSQTGIPQGTRIEMQLLSPEEEEIAVLKGTTAWMAINPGRSYQYQIGVQFAPYGRKKGYNKPEYLEKLALLEERQASE